MNQSVESKSYSRHIAYCEFSPLECGRWSTVQLLRRRIRQGDAHWNDVHQLLQHFSSFAFDRFGRWINPSQQPHSEADLPSFVWIGTGELSLEQRAGSSSGSFVSLFSNLFVNSFHFGAADVGMAKCMFGTCKWTEQRRIHANSPDIRVRSGQFPFHPTAVSSHLPV